MGAVYETSRRVGAIVDRGGGRRPPRSWAATPQEVIFGPNMTSLDFMLSRTAAAGFAARRRDPRLLARPRRRRRAVARARARPGPARPAHRAEADTTLDYDDLESKLGPTARGWSRSPGRQTRSARSSTPRASAELAHDAGALAWIDAVHYAAHEPIDVRAIDADVLICSPYKFCGPHLGIAYGRARAARVAGGRTRRGRRRPRRSAGASRPARCPTSCSPASTRRSTTSTTIGGMAGDRPLRALARRALPRHAARDGDGLRAADARGPRADVPDQRRRRRRRRSVAAHLAERGIGVWAHDSWYSLNLYKRLGYEGERDPRRLHPLQHGRRGRPLRRRAGRPPAAKPPAAGR